MRKLKRTRQCAKCPGRNDVDPRDIPNGYCEQKHAGLARTIASSDPGAQLSSLSKPLNAMACHETDDAHCVGWLMNQLGPGNNIALRIQMRGCENIGAVKLAGEQHARFEDTLPKK
jgi:hypothetical protein